MSFSSTPVVLAGRLPVDDLESLVVGSCQEREAVGDELGLERDLSGCKQRESPGFKSRPFDF